MGQERGLEKLSDGLGNWLRENRQIQYIWKKTLLMHIIDNTNNPNK